MISAHRRRWLEEQSTPTLQELRHQVGAEDEAAIAAILDGRRAAGASSIVIEKEVKAPGKKAHPTGVMDANEQRMALELDARKAVGDVHRWWFEAMTFRLGKIRCHYRPDFLVERTDGILEGLEVKGPRAFKAKRGAQHPAGRVKFLVAAEMYPFMHWRQLQWTGERWRTVRDFPAGERRHFHSRATL